VSDDRARTARTYWRLNVRLLLILLTVWLVVSFGFGVLLAEPLNAFRVFGVQLGFWFAQQGSIFVFVVLIFIYAARMHAIEKRMGIDDTAEPDSYDVMNGDDGVEI